MLLAFAELSVAAEIFACILTFLLVGFLCYMFYKEYKSTKEIQHQEQIFRSTLMEHYRNIDNILSKVVNSLDEDVEF